MNDAFGRPQSVVVLGGTSDIAGAALDMLVADRCRQVVLAGRDGVALEVAAARLRAGGAERRRDDRLRRRPSWTTSGRSSDVCFAALDDQVDLVLVAVGALGEQATDEVDPARVVERIGVNFTWPAAAMTAVAEPTSRWRPWPDRRHLLGRRRPGAPGQLPLRLDEGRAGRVRAGPRRSPRGSGVRLHIVRPGFVFTKMTAGRPPAPFAIGPAAAASAMLRGIERDEPVIWVPSGLRLVVTVARHLPRAAWRRLRTDGQRGRHRSPSPGTIAALLAGATGAQGVGPTRLPVQSGKAARSDWSARISEPLGRHHRPQGSSQPT